MNDLGVGTAAVLCTAVVTRVNHCCCLDGTVDHAVGIGRATIPRHITV